MTKDDAARLWSTMQQVVSLVTDQNASNQALIGSAIGRIENGFQHVQENLARLYRQPPNCATPQQRQQALARVGVGEFQDDDGRTRRYRLERQPDQRPENLAGSLKCIADFWQEWEYGIAGNKPAKLFTNTAQNSKYSRRLPIYKLLERLIKVGGKLPATAFDMVESYYAGMGFTKMAKLIRKQESDGTLPPTLADRSHPLGLNNNRNRGRRLDPGGI